MVRRYDHGVIVGEPDPPKTLGEIATWCRRERELARERADKEPITAVVSRAFLHARAGVLGEIQTILDQAGVTEL